MIDQFRLVLLGMVFLLSLTITPALAKPDFLVEKVVLSKRVDQRNPEGIFTPPAHCEKDKNGHTAIPIVKTSQTSQVVFWTKIGATKEGKIRHSWHHKTDGTWTKISEVNIRVKPSSGYRMWSLKSLNPDLHSGEWMIVVAPSSEPERILCIARFTVK